MPVSMVKRFTLNAVEWKEITAEKRLVIYHVTDEKRVYRKVSGMAEIDRNGRVVSVKPVYIREQPLIQALYGMKHHETVTVDFTDFNKSFKRKGNVGKRSQANYSTERLLSEVSGLSSWLPLVTRYSFIASIAFLLLFLFLKFSEWFMTATRIH